jgi:hypothetical protein
MSDCWSSPLAIEHGLPAKWTEVNLDLMVDYFHELDLDLGLAIDASQLDHPYAQDGPNVVLLNTVAPFLVSRLIQDHNPKLVDDLATLIQRIARSGIQRDVSVIELARYLLDHVPASNLPPNLRKPLVAIVSPKKASSNFGLHRSAKAPLHAPLVSQHLGKSRNLPLECPSVIWSDLGDRTRCLPSCDVELRAFRQLHLSLLVPPNELEFVITKGRWMPQILFCTGRYTPEYPMLMHRSAHSAVTELGLTGIEWFKIKLFGQDGIGIPDWTGFGISGRMGSPASGHFFGCNVDEPSDMQAEDINLDATRVTIDEYFLTRRAAAQIRRYVYPYGEFEDLEH